MASGETITGSLADSLQFIVDSGVSIREHPVVVEKLVTNVTLTPNTGLSWDEIELGKMTAQDIQESEWSNNPQQFADRIRTITPTMSQISTLVTDKTYRRIAKPTIAQMGMKLAEALKRKMDLDGIATFDGATNSQPGTGTTLTTGVIDAAWSNIVGNTTMPGKDPFYGVLHPFQHKDLRDEIEAGVGTYPIPKGMTESTFREGFVGPISTVGMYVDGNIPIVSSNSKGGVFAKEAITLVHGMGTKREAKRIQEFGGGADQIFLTSEWAFGEWTPDGSSVLLWEIFSDTTAPTA